MAWTGAAPPWVSEFRSNGWGPPGTIVETVVQSPSATVATGFFSPTTLITAASTQLSSILSPSTAATNPFVTSSPPTTTPPPSLVTESSIATSIFTNTGTDGSQTIMTMTDKVYSVVTAAVDPTATPASSAAATSSSHSPNIAAIVGGVLGAILALLLIGGFLYWLFTRRYRIQRKDSPKPSHRSTSSGYLGSETTEIGTDTGDAYKQHPIYELDGSNATHEVDPSSALYEVVGSPGGAELSDHRHSARNSARNSAMVKDPFSVYFRPPSWVPGDDV